MKMKLLPAVLASLMIATTPLLANAQSAPAPAAAAQGQAGKSVLDASTRILTTLQQRKSEFSSNPQALRSYIDGELNRTFDRDYAARLVLGTHARGAADADIKLFADAMADNLMQRYGSALLTIQGRPSFRLKGETPLPGNRGVRVSTELVRSGSESTPVDYLMRNVGGQWKIFDVTIEGISYVQTFRNQFDAPLRQKGIKQVATELRSGSMQAAPTGNGK
ncbi:ABC transporter substrate-binding protein [Stenotrophomonas sp. C3(2023)]|uniref:MlaC/ttg2D family ABC transporter substrate-binding protein n=1 Tax=Stenotrophomonas sp. C3(2023) TaxID=3080277 RepID=UPI00293C9004|nr:ABC transporter substrate-binding protein [Stenotrophomonas sp. C3(2023)]MDV3467140.1 ABC transporter substrate-binding protein [Stenotrophomonas sp. C3(2023)]